MADQNDNNRNNDLDSILDRLAEEGSVPNRTRRPPQRPAMRSTARQQQNRAPIREHIPQKGAADRRVAPDNRGAAPGRNSGVKIYDPKNRNADAPAPPVKQQTADKPLKKAKKKKKPMRKSTKRFLTLIAAVFCIGVLSVGIIGGYVLINMEKTVNGDIIVDLDSWTANQSRTSIVYAYTNDGQLTELTRLHGEENRIWVSLDKIPKNLQNAYIALEDMRFRTHHGVDWKRTIGVVVKGIAKGNISQGGSTITQQLIKNLTGESGRTFSRKFNEIMQAQNMEKYYKKDVILEAYLNTLYLDAGCYGVETAAEYYFGKEVQDLNLAECACIAAITKAPRAYNPILNFEVNRERQRWCLDEMYAQELITEEEWREAKDYKLVFNVGENKVTVNSKDDDDDRPAKQDQEYQSYYTDFVIDSVIEDLMAKYDYSYSMAWRQVYYGGLSIITAVDLDIQKQMEDVYYNRVSFPDDEDIQSAMTLMDYSGRICGIVGQAGPKPGNRCANYAADFPRQPGSSIKPLSCYAPGINEDIITYSTKLCNYGIREINGRIWPYNYGGDPGSPNSYKTIQQAIAPSLNTVAARVLDKLSIDTSMKYMSDVFHFTTLRDADADFAPLATGSMTYGVTTLEMAAAYATFGSGGKYYKPYCYYSVKNSEGKVILEPDKNYEQALDPATADVMNELMQTVVTASDGTARKFRMDDQVLFAKTGTTTDNNDSWMCGGTPYYVASVWVGYAESNRELKNIGGNSPSGKIFKEVFDRVHDGLEPTDDFDKSETTVRRAYCRGSGRLASSTCADTGIGWYKEDNIPGYCTNCSVYGSAASTTDPSNTDVTVDPSASATTPTNVGNNDQPSSNAQPTTPPTTPPTTAKPEPPTVAPPIDPEDDR